MKINLLLNNESDVRSGYLNIDPHTPEGDPHRIKGDLTNLNAHVEANEAEEIVALDLLDCFPGSKVDDILEHWLSKLAHGGRLSLSVVDLYEVSHAFLARRISLEDANALLHGEGSNAKQAVFTLEHIAEVLQNRGYKIINKRISNLRAVITCQRP